MAIKQIPKEEKNYDNAQIIESLNNCVNTYKVGFNENLKNSFISCWHYNSTESRAMWGLYLKSNEGIAIKTSIINFKKCFQKFPEDIYAGEIKYKDYESGYYETKGFDFFLPLMHKIKIYVHENEYRAILPRVIGQNKEIILKENYNGVFIPIELELLIEEVIVAPSSPDWFLDLVKETVMKYNLEVEVKRSVVDDKPFEFDLGQFLKENF